MKLLLCIGAGGFLGSIVRYLLTRYITLHWESVYPFATWVVNLTGCLLIGLFIGLSMRMEWFSEWWRAVLMIGFCGSFTTFSTFAGESLQLLRDGAFLYTAVYAVSSFALGLLFTYIGIQMIQIIK